VFLLSQASQDEATKAKDILANELKCLREELKQIRDDRDRQLGQVQSLTGEVAKYKEYTGKSSEQLGTLTAKTSALEEVCTSQRQQIDMLQQQLNAEKEKLKVLSWTDVYMCVLCFSLYSFHLKTFITIIKNWADFDLFLFFVRWLIYLIQKREQCLKTRKEL
jgi:hypothetical protein